MEERIKKIRKENGLTQTEFGSRIGVKGNTITNYETSVRAPSEAMIKAICREFEINREWLETGKGKMKIRSQCNTLDRVAKRYSDSPTFRAMLDVYAELDADGQDAVERYIAKLSKALEEGRDPAGIDAYTDDVDATVDPGATHEAK